MAKWFGVIGYSVTENTVPGVWQNQDIEREYIGDIMRNTSRWSTSSDSTNDDLNISNQLSIIGDQFAYENFHHMKFVEFMGTRWRITNIEVQRPRLLLTLGGVYNG